MYKQLSFHLAQISAAFKAAVRPGIAPMGAVARFVFIGSILASGSVIASGPVIVEGVTLQDPTRPANWQAARAESVKVEKPDITLNSIIYSQQRRLAVLNGQSLSEGQQRNGVKVIKIESRRVLLEWQGERWYASVTPTSSGAISIRRTQ